MLRSAIVACAIALASCSSTQPPVPLLGSNESLAPLAGKWVGEYSSTSTGRRGSIVFTLRADDTVATGDVVMYSNIGPQPYDPNRPGQATRSPAAEPLSITFVRIESGEISGKLDSYRDPETGAQLTTTFIGRVKGDSIEGTFETWSSDAAAPQKGRWKVNRQP